MAARALTAAGCRVAAGRAGPPLLASCRNGASMNHSSASARREEEQYKDVRAAAAAMTGAQVEAALNRKNVEVLHGEEHVATVLPDETIGSGGSPAGEEETSWVPDQDTGVFGPAHVDTHCGAAHPAPPHLFGGATTNTPGGLGSASVLDQAVFIREDMEDVERPAAVDMANANADVNASIKNY